MPPAAPPGRLVDVGGHRLHLLCAGSGTPTVLFDAALGASSLSWSLVQPEVARATRACAYDRAGFGWSDPGPMPRTAGRIAGELGELIRRAGLAPPYVLVGHSFGGLVMRIAAARLGRDVAGVVLVDSAYPEEWLDPGERERRQIARGVRLCRYGATAARLGLARLVAALVGFGALGPARALTRMVSRGGLTRADEEILAPVWKLPPAARRPLYSFWTQPKFFEALGSQIESICQSAAEAGDADLAGPPVTAISTVTTPPRRLALQRAAAGAHPRGRHVIAEKSGHWVPLDEPAVVIAEVLALVEMARRPDL